MILTDTPPTLLDMKKTLLLASILLAGGASAQLVQSGFESWTGGSPDGWVGARTNLPASGISQVTDNVHGGTSAVRLARTAGTHQRFTTQDVAVTNGTTYTVSFWVRGTGQVRVGLFDDRPGGSSGYAPYSAYTTVTSTWTQVTETVSAANSTAQGQFIISLHSTVDPEHMVVDDVVITESGAIPTVSIHDIQYTTNPNGDSPYNGQVVSTSGIVTASYITYNDQSEPQFRYTYLQDGSGAWNGIVIFDYYDNNNTANIGDAVTLTAEVDEFNNLTELIAVQGFTVTATGQAVPAPLVVETGDVASEALESVLVRVVNTTCTEAPGGANFGKYKVDDGSGDAVVGKVMHTTLPNPTVGQSMNITGVVSYGFAEYNIQPRFAQDIETITSIGEFSGATITVFPNPAADVLNIDLGTLSGRTEYTLIDAAGRVVMSDVLTAVRQTIGVGNVANGLYVFTLRNGSAMWSTRVQVQR